jgi:hypothetical protein
MYSRGEKNMRPKTVILVLLACLFAFGIVFGGEALLVEAQQAGYEDRKGIEGLFQGGRDLSGQGPTTFQKVLGFGSVAVMIVVWKWL